jgi:hypothetical protein
MGAHRRSTRLDEILAEDPSPEPPATNEEVD